MKVDDRNTADLSGLTAARTHEAQGTQRAGLDRTAEAQSPAVDDRLQISSLAGRIRQVFEDMAVRHEARVQTLAQQYQNGQYEVDHAALSRALMTQSTEL